MSEQRGSSHSTNSFCSGEAAESVRYFHSTLRRSHVPCSAYAGPRHATLTVPGWSSAGKSVSLARSTSGSLGSEILSLQRREMGP